MTPRSLAEAARAAATLMLTAALLLGGDARAADAAAVTHYVLDPAKSSLEFTFLQAGAQNKGRFTRFQVAFDFAAANLAAGRLDVTVDINSVDTGDQERDETLRGADLFAVAKFPQAHFVASQINRTASGYEAVGKLTIRGVTHDARVPFAFRTATVAPFSVAVRKAKGTRASWVTPRMVSLPTAS